MPKTQNTTEHRRSVLRTVGGARNQEKSDSLRFTPAVRGLAFWMAVVVLIAITGLDGGTTVFSHRSRGAYIPNTIPVQTSYPSPLIFNPATQTNSANYVMRTPRVYLIFWGTKWNDTTTKDSTGTYTNNQAKALLTNFFGSLGGSAWANTLTQYCQGIAQGSTTCSGNFISNPSNLVIGTPWVDTTNSLPGTVNYVAARGEALAAYGHFVDDNGIYMIFTPSGTNWCQVQNPVTGQCISDPCAWHDEMDAHAPEITFGIVPYQTDRGLSCGQEAVNPLISNATSGGYGDGWFDGLTMMAAHEFAEAVTDPFSGGWYDTTGYDGEIGDKCNFSLNYAVARGSPQVSYLVPLGNVWSGGRYYAIQGLWSNADNSCVLPFDNVAHMYMLDGYGGIHPSGSAPSLPSPDYPGYDIARGLAFFSGATGGYWLDGLGGLHAIGNVRSPASLTGVPSWGFDIARALWLAPWSTPSRPGGYILDGYGGISNFWFYTSTPHIDSPHYTSGTDIARGIAILPDQYGPSPSGYMLDGYGSMWQFGTAPAVAHPTYQTDLARGIALLPKTTIANPSGYVLDGFGGMYPFGTAPSLSYYSYFGWDIARAVTSWTFASTSWTSSQTSYVGGWVLDGYGGLHYYQVAPDVSSNAYWSGWDIARGHASSGSGSGAR